MPDRSDVGGGSCGHLLALYLPLPAMAEDTDQGSFAALAALAAPAA